MANDDNNRLGLSLITNFGCDTNCSYCIWNHHPLKKVHGPNNWDKISKIFSFFPQEKISISGGGDPLFQFPDVYENWHLKSWYDKLFSICDKKIDIHTSKLIDDTNFIQKFNKYVLHLDWNRFLENKDKLIDFPISLRLVFVLIPPGNIETAFYIKEKIETLVKFSEKIDCQLSFREYYHYCRTMTGIEIPRYPDRLETSLIEYVKSFAKKNKKIHFIKQDDYNIYYMPDDQIYTDFMCRRKPIC